MKKVLGIILFTAFLIVLGACDATTSTPFTTTSITEMTTATTPSGVTELETVTLELYGTDETLVDSAIVGFTDQDTLLGLVRKTFGAICQGADGNPDETCSFSGPYGIYVIAVGSVTAYESNQYIAFYIDGAYAMTGISATDLVAGTVYAFHLQTF